MILEIGNVIGFTDSVIIDNLRLKLQTNDEGAKDEKVEEQDEPENKPNMVEETQVDNPDEIIVTEIF